MSRDQDLAALSSLYCEAIALNRQVLQALRDGKALLTLDALFQRKAALQGELQALQGELDRQRPGGDQGPLQAAFQAQREAATTEAQLAEALGKIVPQGGNAASAYAKFTVEKRDSKLDSSV